LPDHRADTLICPYNTQMSFIFFYLYLLYLPSSSPSTLIIISSKSFALYKIFCTFATEPSPIPVFRAMLVEMGLHIYGKAFT
jgi:hypothetical protein